MAPNVVTQEDFQRHRDKIAAQLSEFRGWVSTQFEGQAAERLGLERFMRDEFKEMRQVIKEEFADLRKELKEEYVTQDEFAPVRNVVYGMVGVILLSVIGALIALVII